MKVLPFHSAGVPAESQRPHGCTERSLLSLSLFGCHAQPWPLVNSPEGPRNPQNLQSVFFLAGPQLHKIHPSGGPETYCTGSSFTGLVPKHDARRFQRGTLRPVYWSPAPLMLCFCTNDHSPGPSTLKTSDVTLQNSGHQGPWSCCCSPALSSMPSTFPVNKRTRPCRSEALDGV